jgi:L-asparaginase
LKSIGITSGSDITTEAAITKLMFLLGQETEPQRVKYRMEQSICGEMS